MEALIEKIMNILHHLPKDELQEVLDFAEVLARHKHLESTQLKDAAFEATADQLADELAQYAGPNVPKLSDYSVSRASIYEDQP
jgi:hypothetical protein